MNTSNADLKKLQAQVDRLEAIVKQLAARLVAVERENKRLRSAASRTSMQLGAVEQRSLRGK